MVQSWAALDARLRAACAEGGAVSVWAGRIDGAPTYEHDSTTPHYAASTMKLPLAIAALRQVARGDIALERAVRVHNDFASVADGSTFSLDELDDQDPSTWRALGGTRTVAELVESAIVHSGNLATNLLLDVVGHDEVAEVLRLAGCTAATIVGRGIEDMRAREAGITNTVTARDLGVVMAAVARREPALGGAAVLAPVEEVLSRQEHRNQIPAGLPHGVRTANKTGWVTGVSHDVCLVRPTDRPPFVLAVCTTVDLSEDDAAALVAAVAHDYWEATGP